LTPEQLKSFEEDGFLWIEGLLTDSEVENYRNEMDRMISDEAIRDSEVSIIEKESQNVRSIFEIHKRSETFKRLAQDKRLADAARQIVGSDVYIHQSRINLKQEMHGAGFFWHSDFETWHTEDGLPRCRTVSASVALTENNEFNGPLMVVPGSHKTFVSCVGETPENNFESSLKQQELGTPDLASLKQLVDRSPGITAPKGPAGSVLLFDCNIMHASTENLSPFPRSNAFFVFNSVENTPGNPFAAPSPRPEYIGSRDFTPVDQI
jgi:ectoine hydroxylase